MILLKGLALALASLAFADELTPAKKADVVSLIKLTDTTRFARQYADTAARSVYKVMKLSRPSLPETAEGLIAAEAEKLFEEKAGEPGGLVDRLTAVYAARYSHAEVKELLAFYRTPTGRKTLDMMPDLWRETVEAGNRWGRALRPEIRRRAEKALDRAGAK